MKDLLALLDKRYTPPKSTPREHRVNEVAIMTKAAKTNASKQASRAQAANRLVLRKIGRPATSAEIAKARNLVGTVGVHNQLLADNQLTSTVQKAVSGQTGRHFWFKEWP